MCLFDYHIIILGKLRQTIFFFRCKIRTLHQWLETLPRKLGCNDRRFEPLRQLCGKYKGKRIFITCTGPSLTIDDLELLKDEYTFGMNSICLIHDKTNWKPDFFGIQDSNVYIKVVDSLLSTDNGIIFAPFSYKKSYNTPENWVYFNICGAYIDYDLVYRHNYAVKFSDDCYSVVYGGYSITYSILQLAVYMGFDEVYLLGADCSYLGEKQHFIEHGNLEPPGTDVAKRLFAAYAGAKKYADENGIKIYNATRGGFLEIFPRVTLEDVLSRVEKNKVA